MGMDPRATICFGIAYTNADKLPSFEDEDGEVVDLQEYTTSKYPSVYLSRRGGYDYCEGSETLCIEESRRSVYWGEFLDVVVHLAKFEDKQLVDWCKELRKCCEELGLPYRTPTWTMSAFYG